MLYPQEIEVFYIIPALRREIAKELKNRGIRQKEIANLFHVEEASISQYLGGKRGGFASFSKGLMPEIKISAGRIKDTISLLGEMQRLIKIVKITGDLCRIHKQLSPIPICCSPKMINCFPIKK